MIALYYTEFDSTGLSKGELRKKEHLLGNRLCSHVLQNDFGVNSPSFGTSESGKPKLIGSNLEYNISHTDGKVVLAVSDTPIGVDIEKIDRTVPDRLAQKYLNQKNTTVKDWVQFESYAKYTGNGIFKEAFPPEKSVFFQYYRQIPGYLICVCSIKNRFPSEPILLSL